MGILGYFAITEGEHLFGKSYDRQRNIAEAKPIFDDKKCPQSFYKDVLAKELIMHMTKRESSERPSANDVLEHPYFWDEDKITSFFRIFSNSVGSSNRRRLQ